MANSAEYNAYKNGLASEGISSTKGGPNSYRRLNIKDERLSREVNDLDITLEAELVKKRLDENINIPKNFKDTTVDVPGNSSWQYKEGHLPERLNLAKEVNMWIGNDTETRGDWHLKEVNKICNVSKRIRLYPESLNSLTLSYKYAYEKAKNFTPGKGVYEKLSDLLDVAGALGLGNVQAERVSVWDQPKVFKDLENLKVDGSMKFKFHFGMAGLFDGLEEVVKPIYALASMMAVGDAANADAVGALPLPTQAQFSTMFLLGAYHSIKDEATKKASKGWSELFKETDNLGKTAIDLAAFVQSTYFNAIKDGNKTVFLNEGSIWNLFYFQIGNFLMGPCTVGGIKWTFDMTNLDENGWPISGWIELTDIEHYTKATRGIISKTLFKGVNLE